MRDFLLLLPHLTLNAKLDVEYAAAEPALLQQLADNAETAMRMIHLGIAALGHLQACSAPEIECGDVPSDVIEALGWLTASLGDFAAVAHCISVACRMHTADYIPRAIKVVPNARP